MPDGLVADSQRQLRRGHLTFYPFQEHDVGWYVRVVDHDPVQLGDQALRLGTRSNGDDVIHPVPVVAEVGALPKFEEMVGEGGEIRPPVKIGGELETRPPSGLRFDSMSDHLGGVVVRAEDELMPDLGGPAPLPAQQELRVPSYLAGFTVSNHALITLADALRAHRRGSGSDGAA